MGYIRAAKVGYDNQSEQAETPGGWGMAIQYVRFLAEKFMPGINSDVIGRGLNLSDNSVDNHQLVQVNAAIRDHSIEVVGRKLRGYMTGMKAIV